MAKPCTATTDQIEIVVQSFVSEPLIVRLWNETGQQSITHYFGYCGSKNTFISKRNDCMSGKWKFDVCRLFGKQPNVVESQRILLDGIGCLYFTIEADLRLHLQQQLWLRVAHKSSHREPILLEQGNL
ncbi:unnamed protein product [Toxocara canis]|uniref:Transposase n=1 Tax=Toxocara canis TaxID=6265 RepID=A0A183TX66_TOXCA|nr:unnamed protein product [Toxocara canis]